MASPDAGPPDWIGTDGLGVSFDNHAALADVSLRLRPGEFHVLVGNHNDGKSTLCRALAGIVPASVGAVWVDGKPRRRYGIPEAAGLGIEYLGENAEIFPHLSAVENVAVAALGSRRAGAGPNRDKAALRGWLAGFGLTDLGRPAADLPAEDRLLVKALGCLYKNPRLLILDETLEQFSQERRRLFVAELRERLAGGMGVLWATHKLDDALDLADVITVLRNGRRYLSVASSTLDRRSLIRLTYSSTRGYPGDSRDDLEGYFNLINYSEVLLENLPSAVLIMDAAERVQFMNQAAARLFNLEDGAYHSGMAMTEALGGCNGFLLDLVRQCLTDRAGGGVDSRVFDTGIGETLVDARVLAVADNQRRPAAMLIIDDVSEREAMRRQLTIAHNLTSIGMLAAGVAHEVNNPLESIGNYISYLLRREEGVEARRILESVQKEAGYIRDIVTNLVMFSGKGERKGRDVDLAEMVRDIVHMLGYNARYDDIEIDLTLAAEPLVLCIDPNELRQILLNLIRNGMEAMPDGGAIAIATTRLAGGMGRIAVRDHGPGLPAGLDHDNDIFLPFVSGKNGDANQGLGLAIVYGLVKKWGGEITVEPAAPGTRFLVDLPLSGQSPP